MVSCTIDRFMLIVESRPDEYNIGSDVSFFLLKITVIKKIRNSYETFEPKMPKIS